MTFTGHNRSLTNIPFSQLVLALQRLLRCGEMDSRDQNWAICLHARVLIHVVKSRTVLNIT